jgi:hypothetical protein
MDLALRHAERSGDPVTLLRERLRAGNLTQGHVQLAASLGHAAARVFEPDMPRVRWFAPGKLTDEDVPRAAAIRRATELCGSMLPVHVAADWVERALPVWELASDDPSPTEQLAAARSWATCPCEKHSRALKATLSTHPTPAHQDPAVEAWAADAARAARSLAQAACDADSTLAPIEAAERAREAAAQEAADEVASDAFYDRAEARGLDEYEDGVEFEALEVATREEFFEPAYRTALALPLSEFLDDRFAADPDELVLCAARLAYESAALASYLKGGLPAYYTPDAEYNWQRLRLAAYVLGDVEQTPVTTPRSRVGS